jgi:hypothetical protein
MEKSCLSSQQSLLRTDRWKGWERKERRHKENEEVVEG